MVLEDEAEAGDGAGRGAQGGEGARQGGGAGAGVAAGGGVLHIGASAGDGRVHLQGAGVPLTGETRGAPAEGGARAGREAPVVGRGAIVGRGAQVERGVRAKPRMEEEIAGAGQEV